MNGTLTPKLGDFRFSATRDTEIYILVNGIPAWREARWEIRNNYFCSRDGMKPIPYHVAMPILGENEVLRETEMGPVEILSIPLDINPQV